VNSLIEDIISEKPHLAGPLRFYEKTLRFRETVRALGPLVRPGLHAYPRNFTAAVIVHLTKALELPEGSLSPLLQALELGEIDFTRLPLGDVPAFSLPYAEDDLTMLLFILSRPYFFGLREARPADGGPWNEGRCPLCGARPAITSEEKDGNRQAFCSFCGTTGNQDSAGCPVCGMTEGAIRHFLSFEGGEGVRVHTCNRCRSYVKVLDQDLLVKSTVDLADLVSIPLDILVQQKGYIRRSPNPIGMVRMSTGG
jgi:FdhE protein